MQTQFDPSFLSALRPRNPEPNSSSRTGFVSLPIPPDTKPPHDLTGLPAHGVDIAWWPPSPGAAEQVPRRRILYTVADAAFPDSLRFGKPGALLANAAQAAVSLRDLHKDYKNLLPQHSGELVLTRGAVEFRLRMSLRWRDELHWWEWIGVEQLWSSPVVSAYHLGGAIGLVPVTAEEVFPNRTNIRKSEWLHRQNWLRGAIHMLCFANGVVQLHCRHINNHVFDEGRDQNDVTPLIGGRIPKWWESLHFIFARMGSMNRFRERACRHRRYQPLRDAPQNLSK